MKKLRYSTGMKISFIFIQQFFAVIFIIMIVLLSTLFQKKMFNPDNLFDDTFANSGYYNVIFERTFSELMEYVLLKEMFEQDGQYNENSYIDVIDYANGELFNHDKTAKRQGAYSYDRYKLKDLLSWSQEGYKVEKDGLIQETYLPQSGTSLHDAVKNHEIELFRAQRISRALYEALQQIQEDLLKYKKSLNKYDVNGTNVKYWIGVDSMQKTYTNMSAKQKSDVLGQIEKRKGSYLYYDSSSFHLKTKIGGMQDYFYNYMDSSTKDIGNMPTIMISIDTNFAQNDDFKSAQKEFKSYHPWFFSGGILLAVSFFVWLFTLIYLTMAAGMNDNRKTYLNKEQDKVVLNWFDRLWTEFLFLGFLTFVTVMTLFTVRASYTAWHIPDLLMMAGTMGYVGDSVFLILYLSMIRRIKAETLWKESFCYKCINAFTNMIHHWKISVRLLLIYTIEIVLFLLITYFVFLQKSALAVVLLILFVGVKISFIVKEELQRDRVLQGIKKISDGNISYKIATDGFYGSNKDLAESVNRIGEGLARAVDENTKSERMKADLVTNVSHDIKTPLTSIINYVNLIKREEIKNDNIKSYVDILDNKAERLKQLTEDLVEASKISSGNIELDMQCIDFVELVYQTGGEFNEKFENKDLTIITKLPNESVIIMADGRRIWRVIENLYNNAAKYALAHTRIYVSMETREDTVIFSIKNISEKQIKVETDELTERFIRGDTARTTEGSGLGLSIAKNLTELMNGVFLLDLDGDLFKVDIIFPLATTAKIEAFKEQMNTEIES